MEEIWKDIPQFEGRYQASNLGKIRGVNRRANHFSGTRNVPEKVLAQRAGSDGYLKCNLSKNGSKTKPVHILVAMAFLGHTPNGMAMQVNHIDGNKINNKAENLEVVTARYNATDACLRKNTRSKYTGVYWHGPTKTWYSRIRENNKIHYLGYYKNEIDAADAYLIALHELN